MPTYKEAIGLGAYIFEYRKDKTIIYLLGEQPHWIFLLNLRIALDLKKIIYALVEYEAKDFTVV